MNPHWRSTAVRLATTGCAVALAMGATCEPPNTFVNWENHPVHGLDLTPDGSRLLAVNTADGRLEVFDLSGSTPTRSASIPVGLDPVSVRALDDSTAWVVNRVSDSVSVVNLGTSNVVATLATGDEPSDVIFAGAPLRAFVSVSQDNTIEIRDPASLSTSPIVVPVEGEEPRALATDGTRVYAALFESGNRTTIVGTERVSNLSSPYGGQNPPPNASSAFVPPVASGLPTPPPSSIIVRKSPTARWLDVGGADWTSLVTWDLVDHDVAVLPASNPTQVSYVSGLMNLDMALAVTSAGRVAVVGTEALNHVRFEPNVKAQFVRVVMASFDPASPSPSVADLNPHLDYSVTSVVQAERNKSLADPRGLAWSRSTNRGFVSGMGSNNVIAIDASGARLGRVDVGQGPTSLALDEARNRLYVLNRFAGSISVVDPTAMIRLADVTFYDPTPSVVRAGRPLLYDAHATSGLGQVACASCHVDGRTDALAWDLGDPTGAVKTFNQVCRDTVEICENWHPMKGPLTTQTLQGIVGTEPLHWRGDREDLAAFAGAFKSLLGDDVAPSAQQMQDLENLTASMRFAPNPFRNLDGTVQNATLANGGNPSAGQNFFNNVPIDQGQTKCVECHPEPSGTNGQIIAAATAHATQSLKVPQIRNMYQKRGLSFASSRNTRGFGFVHDGSADTLIGFLHSLSFEFPPGPPGDQDRRDLEAFILSFATDTHAAVGQQLTVNEGNKSDPATLIRADQLLQVAGTGAVGLVVKGRIAGVQRGGYYLGNDVFQMDRTSEKLTPDQLLTGIAAGQEETLTVVPFEARIRIGVDRDSDGRFDRDELDQGRDPANPGG